MLHAQGAESALLENILACKAHARVRAAAGIGKCFYCKKLPLASGAASQVLLGDTPVIVAGMRHMHVSCEGKRRYEAKLVSARGGPIFRGENEGCRSGEGVLSVCLSSWFT